jgi:hypothetical protein
MGHATTTTHDLCGHLDTRDLIADMLLIAAEAAEGGT